LTALTEMDDLLVQRMELVSRRMAEIHGLLATEFTNELLRDLRRLCRN
jgi:hypothetical protein